MRLARLEDVLEGGFVFASKSREFEPVFSVLQYLMCRLLVTIPVPFRVQCPHASPALVALQATRRQRVDHTPVFLAAIINPA